MISFTFDYHWRLKDAQQVHSPIDLDESEEFKVIFRHALLMYIIRFIRLLAIFALLEYLRNAQSLESRKNFPKKSMKV